MTDAELRELDVQVHCDVMGHPSACDCGPRPNGYDPETGRCHACGMNTCPRYSTDIAVAWRVVEKLRLTVTPQDEACGGNWLADQELKGPFQLFQGWGKTAPIAICRAALVAVASDPGLARVENRV